MGEKNQSTTQTWNTDSSQNTDQSVGAGSGANSVNLGTGATYTSSDPAVTQAALDAMSSNSHDAFAAQQQANSNVRDVAIASGWQNLYGAQTAIAGMGTLSSQAIGDMGSLAAGVTGAGLSLAGDVTEMVLGNEGRLLRDNAATNQQAFTTAQSLGNNAQNLGLGAFNTASTLGANAFASATHMADVGAAQNMALADRNADLVQGLGTGAFDLASHLGDRALQSANEYAQQVTQLADSSQTRMADLVTQNQAYDTELAKTAATGGASDMLKTFMWVAIAGIAAFFLSGSRSRA